MEKLAGAVARGAGEGPLPLVSPLRGGVHRGRAGPVRVPRPPWTLLFAAAVPLLLDGRGGLVAGASRSAATWTPCGAAQQPRAAAELPCRPPAAPWPVTL